MGGGGINRIFTANFNEGLQKLPPKVKFIGQGQNVAASLSMFCTLKTLLIKTRALARSSEVCLFLCKDDFTE